MARLREVWHRWVLNALSASRLKSVHARIDDVSPLEVLNALSASRLKSEMSQTIVSCIETKVLNALSASRLKSGDAIVRAGGLDPSCAQRLIGITAEIGFANCFAVRIDAVLNALSASRLKSVGRFHAWNPNPSCAQRLIGITAEIGENVVEYEKTCE